MPSVHAEPSISGLVAGASYKGYPTSFEDPSLLVHHRDVASGRTPGIPDVGYDRANSITCNDGNPAPAAESNILFVDGLPTDCTRREIGRILASVCLSFWDFFSSFGILSVSTSFQISVSL